MTFLNFSLLAGAGLIVVPIILHLIMRQKPKLLEFPALRFIQKRHDTNQRRLRLRHLLLLLLRAGVIALLALALARPSVKLSHNLGNQESPVAAALVFDAAPRMQYRRENKSRLETAKELGVWLLAQLPPESQIAVMDTGTVSRGFDVDRGLSKQRIERLDTITASKPLVRVVDDAAALLRRSDRAAKEIYVFTDLSRAAWPAEAATSLQDHLRETAGVSVYLIDVGVSEPNDFSLGDIRLSQQVVAVGGSVEIQTEVSSLGAEGERVVELDLLGADGKPQKISERIVRIKPGEGRPVEFQLNSLKAGVQQGVVRIVGQDSLVADDVRYFSVEVRPAWPVLVVAQRPAAEHAIYLTSAIAPPEYRKRGEARFDCRVKEYSELSGLKLEEFAAVCLLDPPGLEPGVWQRLTDYAAAGHGVGIFLGRHAQAIEAFNSPAPQQLLPGKLKEQVPRSNGETFLAPQNFQHPVLKAFSSRATSTPWSAFPVYRYWRVDDLPSGAGTVMTYNDGRPALVERSIQAGRVLLLTTPISDRATRDAWNLLPVPALAKPWPFIILANQMMSYLVGSGQQQLNYFAGETVSLALNDQGRRRTYVLASPGGVKAALPPQDKAEITISAVEQIGNYQLLSAGGAAEADHGFSVNLPLQLTQLQRLSESEVSEMFGSFKPQIAGSSEQIDRKQHEGRVGREIFPWLILVLAGVLALEYVASNWFYKQG